MMPLLPQKIFRRVSTQSTLTEKLMQVHKLLGPIMSLGIRGWKNRKVRQVNLYRLEVFAVYAKAKFDHVRRGS
jgi:hypothetical protein